MPLPLPLSAPSPGPACCPRHAAGPLRAPARRHPGTGQGATACGSFLTPLELRNARTLCPMAAGRIVPVIVTPIRPSPVSARVFFARHPVRRACARASHGRDEEGSFAFPHQLLARRNRTRPAVGLQRGKCRPPTPRRSVDSMPPGECRRPFPQHAAAPGIPLGPAPGEPADRLQICNSRRPRCPRGRCTCSGVPMS